MKEIYRVCLSNKMGIGIATGVAIGAGFGAAMESMAQAIGYGAAFGIVLGAVWTKRSINTHANNSQQHAPYRRWKR
jgi:hypothetical protein